MYLKRSKSKFREKAKYGGEKVTVYLFPHTVYACEYVGVCVGSFTIHQYRFDRLDAGHNFCQVSEGSVGTRNHLKDTHIQRDHFNLLV